MIDSIIHLNIFLYLYLSEMSDIYDKPTMYYDNRPEDYEIHNSSITDNIDEDTLFEIKLMMGTILFCSFFVQCANAWDICGRIDKRVRSWRLNRHLNEHLLKPDSTEECSICLESYQEKDKIVQLTCTHIFHKDCIREWLQNKQNNCPLCRLPVRLSV